MNITPDKVAQLEHELSRIRNVSYSSIILDAEGRISNIDILSDTQRSPNGIVRDAEVILRKNGVKLDHRKIGVVQMVSAHDIPSSAEASEPDIRPQPAVLEVVPERERIRLSAVHSTTAGGTFAAEVELALGAFEGAPGRADGAAQDGPTCVEVVARASVEAVRNLLEPGHEVHLRAASVHDLGGVSLVTVLVDFGRERQLRRLCGVCEQRGSLYEAAVYAVLNALNRPLGRARFRELMIQDAGADAQEMAWRAASA